jgi:hypothetical protein
VFGLAPFAVIVMVAASAEVGDGEAPPDPQATHTTMPVVVARARNVLRFRVMFARRPIRPEQPTKEYT